MPRMPEREYSRRPGFMHTYAQEAARMTSPLPVPPVPPVPPAPPARDEAVLLPLLLLLMTEGADKWLLLALVYILM